MFHAHAPIPYWFNAFSTAIYIINGMPTPVLDNKSSFEILFNCSPNYGTFKVFGCCVIPYLCDYAPHKLAPRSHPCIFLEYSSTLKGFQCFDHIASHTYITRHAQFDEYAFSFSTNFVENSTNLEYSQFLEFQDLDKSTSPSCSSPCGLNSPLSAQVQQSGSSTPIGPCRICAPSTAEDRAMHVLSEASTHVPIIEPPIITQAAPDISPASP